MIYYEDVTDRVTRTSISAWDYCSDGFGNESWSVVCHVNGTAGNLNRDIYCRMCRDVSGDVRYYYLQDCQ